MIAQPHANDADLKPLTVEELESLIPAGPHVVVLRESSSEREPPQVEHWGRDFVMSRLMSDGAFDASGVSNDPDYGIVTRAIGGERLFVRTNKELF